MVVSEARAESGPVEPAATAPQVASLESAAAARAQQAERAEKAHSVAKEFAAAFDLPEPAGAIVPLVLGSELAAQQAQQTLAAAGFYVPAIRPPTVPQGTARLRFAFSALHTPEDVQQLIDAVRPLWQKATTHAA